jgi:hypothetical protein
MTKLYVFAIIAALTLAAASFWLMPGKPTVVKASDYSTVFDSQGRLQLPTGFRRAVGKGLLPPRAPTVT